MSNFFNKLPASAFFFPPLIIQIFLSLQLLSVPIQTLATIIPSFFSTFRFIEAFDQLQTDFILVLSQVPVPFGFFFVFEFSSVKVLFPIRELLEDGQAYSVFQ
jgi:hypothetical protein